MNFLQNSQGKERLSQPSTTGTPHTKKVTKGKKIKSQDTQVSRGHSTLDRWFLPTSKQSSFLDSEGLHYILATAYMLMIVLNGKIIKFYTHTFEKSVGWRVIVFRILLFIAW